MKRAALVGLIAAIAACAPSIPPGPEKPFDSGAQPDEPRLGAALPAGSTRYSHRSLADLFVRLTHDLEWGEKRPHLMRYEEAVRVGLSGSASAQYASFLDGYLAEIRAQTGIDIARHSGPHNLSIRFVPGNAFRRRVPQNVCVVAPGRLDWSTFGSSPSEYGTRAYEVQTEIRAMTVFIPDNAEPWLVRQCLIEEIAQALGPANDLYGLGPSIFNDDGAHVWPTALDYLMLRVLYAPELRTGLNRLDTRRRASQALRRLNPAGSGAPDLPPLRIGAIRIWEDTLRMAFDRTRPMPARFASAQKAASLAERRLKNTAYHCRSLAALVRLGREQLPVALDAASRGRRVCATAHGVGDVRLARLQLEGAYRLYQSGEPAGAIEATRGLEATFAAFGQDERLVALYALQAAALRAIQDTEAGFLARRKAAAW
ncbi:MAG: DUF2927 domain-containing protein, partial [Pseudomonadota bacterium]